MCIICIRYPSFDVGSLGLRWVARSACGLSRGGIFRPVPVSGVVVPSFPFPTALVPALSNFKKLPEMFPNSFELPTSKLPYGLSADSSVRCLSSFGGAGNIPHSVGNVLQTLVAVEFRCEENDENFEDTF